MVYKEIIELLLVIVYMYFKFVKRVYNNDIVYVI